MQSMFSKEEGVGVRRDPAQPCLPYSGLEELFNGSSLGSSQEGFPVHCRIFNSVLAFDH